MRHCWHDVATDQRDSDMRCCHCGVVMREYGEIAGHGTALGPITGLIDRGGQPCPAQPAPAPLKTR